MTGRRDLFFSSVAQFTSILTPLFLPSSSVSISHLILAVPMRECLGKHLCKSYTFPMTILNGTCSLRSAKTAIRS